MIKPVYLPYKMFIARLNKWTVLSARGLVPITPSRKPRPLNNYENLAHGRKTHYENPLNVLKYNEKS